LCINLLLWIHHYTPESNQKSRKWTETGCSAPKEARSVPATEKVMASLFCDAEGILFIDYIEKGKTITGEYYSNLLTRLDEKIREKRPGLQKKKSSFIRTMHLPTKVFWHWEN
jgi:histone-lysine N-methyltransferase SETMAR